MAAERADDPLGATGGWIVRPANEPPRPPPPPEFRIPPPDWDQEERERLEREREQTGLVEPAASLHRYPAKRADT